MPLALGPVAGVDAGIRDTNALAGNPKSFDDVVRRVLRVREDDVAARCRAGGRSVHTHRARMQPFGVAQRAQIVDHRGANARTSRRDHPVREMEHVRLTEEAFCGGTSQPAPGRAHGVPERHRRDPPLDRKTCEGRVEQLAPADAHRTEGDELLRSVRRLHHALQSAEDVIADARPRCNGTRESARRARADPRARARLWD